MIFLSSLPRSGSTLLTSLKLKGKGLGVIKIGDFKTLDVETWPGWPTQPHPTNIADPTNITWPEKP